MKIESKQPHISRNARWCGRYGAGFLSGERTRKGAFGADKEKTEEIIEK